MRTRWNYATPTLMRAARGAYAQSIRAQLHAIGVDDLPRNGAFILAGIDTSGGPRPDLPAGLGVSKQAVSQLIDTLVSRGYLTRGPDPGDRRRISLELTGRGQEVVAAVQHGVDDVDHRLLERVPAAQVEAMRTVLATLAEINVTGAGERRRAAPAAPASSASSAPSSRSVTWPPRWPTTRRSASARWPTRTATSTASPAGTAPGCTWLRTLTTTPGTSTRGAAYLYVLDADALYAEWARPGIGGQTRPVGPTPYGLREGSHLDPDGNLIRFGSAVAGP